MEITNLESFLSDRRKSIIRMHHDIASYLDSSLLGEDFLQKSTKRVLEESCETLRFSQGEIYLLLDKKGNIPKIGESKEKWYKIKPIASIGFEENELDEEKFTYSRENYKEKGPIDIALNGNIFQMCRNKEYIKSLENNGILRKGFWEEILENPDTKDTRNVMIPITRKINGGLFEVPGFANFSIPKYEIKEDELVPDILLEVAKEAIDSVTDYLVQFSLLDELRKSSIERERLAKQVIRGLMVEAVNHEIRNAVSVPINTTNSMKIYIPKIIEQYQNLKGLQDTILKGDTSKVKDLTEKIQKIEQRFKIDQNSRKLLEDLNLLGLGLESVIARVEEIYELNKQMEYPLEKVDLNKSLEDTITRYKLNQRTKIETDYDKSNPQIKSSYNALRLVYSSLIENAIIALEKTKDPKIIIITKKYQDKNTLIIQDNGQGISPESMSMIFDPYFTTRKGKGKGLGLYLVQNILIQQKATIRAESELEKGTKMIIEFPVIN